MQTEAQTQFTTDDLARVAPAFDALANPLPRIFLQNHYGECAIVDMERLISNLAAREGFFVPQVTFKTGDNGVTFINNKSWPASMPAREIRFNQARAVATTLLIKHESEGYLSEDAALRHTVDIFNAAGRLGTSGIDLVACAILMPKNLFNRIGQRKTGDIEGKYTFIRRMAGAFDLPRGAIAVRQVALQYA